MRLSKFFYIPASIIIILKLICCDVDKLNLVNPNVLTPETFFTTENQVQQAVNAVYADNANPRPLSTHHFLCHG